MTGFIPSGYFHDPVKTAETFPTLRGRRWSIPGDWATVDADGTIRLLGRGNQCINTGGEKVYPEEVEEALKQHPDVADAAVVGVPDVRYGQAVVALVEGTADPDALIEHVRRSLAGYKVPKRIVFVDTLNRAPTGKLNYPSLLARAVAAPER